MSLVPPALWLCNHHPPSQGVSHLRESPMRAADWTKLCLSFSQWLNCSCSRYDMGLCCTACGRGCLGCLHVLAQSSITSDCSEIQECCTPPQGIWVRSQTQCGCWWHARLWEAAGLRHCHPGPAFQNPTRSALHDWAVTKTHVRLITAKKCCGWQYSMLRRMTLMWRARMAFWRTVLGKFIGSGERALTQQRWDIGLACRPRCSLSLVTLST